MRPLRFIGRNIILGPGFEAARSLCLEIFDADSRIEWNVSCSRRPLKQPTHCLEKIPGSGGRFLPSIQTGLNRRPRDLAKVSIAALFEDMKHDVFALAS